MFGIDWNEAIIIGLVAILVIGPKELPGVMRGLGQSLNKIRAMAGKFRAEFDQAMKEADLKDLKDSADSLRGAVSSFRGATSPMSMIKNEIMGVGDTIKEAVAPPSAAPSAVATAALPVMAAPAAEPVVNVPAVEPAPVVLPDAPKPQPRLRNRGTSEHKEALANAATGTKASTPVAETSKKRAPAKQTDKPTVDNPKIAKAAKKARAAEIPAPPVAEARKRSRKAVGVEA